MATSGTNGSNGDDMKHSPQSADEALAGTTVDRALGALVDLVRGATTLGVTTSLDATAKASEMLLEGLTEHEREIVTLKAKVYASRCTGRPSGQAWAPRWAARSWRRASERWGLIDAD